MNYENEKVEDLDVTEFEVVLDPVKDKEFIEKWGLEQDVIPFFEVDEEGTYLESKKE